MLHLNDIVVALASSNSSSPPSIPIGGAILWWIICSRRKHHSIGGWLLFYFWQVFSGAALSIILMLTFAYRNYVPELFGDSDPYGLFLLSVVPPTVLLLVEAAVALMLLRTRLWQVLKILRAVALLELCFEWTGVAIDAAHFPDNSPMSVISAVTMTSWTFYLFFSRRVERVFRYDDWEQATPTNILGLS
jgi:hypothetical protein